VCPKCSFENVEDTDFCAKCGNYLRWNPTQLIAAVPAQRAEEPEPETDVEQIDVPTPEATPVEQGATVTLVLPATRTETTAATPVATSSTPGVRPEAVVVSLRLPDASVDEEQLVVEAGGQASLIALIRNQSGIVDNYEILVNGVPAEWWTATPPTVYLVPFGAPGGNYEQEVELRFHPPRSALAEARAWPVTVDARSKAEGLVLGSASADLVITPYEQLESELRPELVAGRRKGRFALKVLNRANAPIEVLVTASDAQGACRVEFDRPQFTAEPGRRAGTVFAVLPRKPIWIGRSADRRLEVGARAVGGEAVAQPHYAVFRQRPWIPWWVAVVVPLVAAAAALVLTLLPKKTTVPDLRGQRIAQAQILLDRAGLKLSPSPPREIVANAPGGTIMRLVPAAGSKVNRGTVIEVQVAAPRVPKLIGKSQDQARLILQKAGLKLSSSPPENTVSRKPVGTIVAQVPGAGRRVKSGTEVSIKVAVGSGKRSVPNVVGLTPADAEKAIRRKGLTMAPIQLPPGVDAAKAHVSSQIPSAGEVIDASEPVSVFVPPPAQPTPATVPPVAGVAAAAAAAALAKLGVVVSEVRRFDRAPPGTVIGQIPPKGSKLQAGQQVQLIVSAGYPEIAYSDGKDLRVIGGFDGKSVKTLAATPDLEDEPSWQPNGTLVAYRRGPSSDFDKGRIWLVDSSRPASARPLTAGPDDRRPAFSPDGRIVAFSRRESGSDRDLCFVNVRTGPASTTCISDPNVSVDRPAWAPDGSAILAIAIDPKDANQIELIEYRSARPSSMRPSDWVSQGLVTDSMHGKRRGEAVIFAAWAPDGKRAALVSNWGSADPTFFHVLLAATNSDVIQPPKPVVPQIRACTVSWRSDSGELAVTRADDCSRGVGAIVRADPRRSASQVPLRQFGSRDPAWQFISLNRR
jgi:beta-lactam-binding protein with PASTA domain